MEITPQLLKEIEFKEAWRGYDREQVDALLERIGSALAQMQGRLREALDRADSAEARALAAGGRSEAEDTLRRTLVLAQRTADAAVAEAEQEAARLRADALADAEKRRADADGYAAEARREADSYSRAIRADADQLAVRLKAEAEAEARRVAEATRTPLLDEIRDLERVRTLLQDDVAALERHLAEQRAKVRESLTSITRLLDLPEAFRTQPPPALSGVEVPASARVPSSPPAGPSSGPGASGAASSLSSPSSGGSSPSSGAASSSLSSGGSPSTGSSSAGGSSTGGGSPSASAGGASTPPRASAAAAGVETEARGALATEAPPDWADDEASFSLDESPWDVAEPAVAPGPPTEPVATVADTAGRASSVDDATGDRVDDAAATGDDLATEAGASDDALGALDLAEPARPSRSDEFLAQLRRAVDEDTDDEPGMSAFFDTDDERPRSRFGRRR